MLIATLIVSEELRAGERHIGANTTFRTVFQSFQGDREDGELSLPSVETVKQIKQLNCVMTTRSSYRGLHP